MIQNKNSILAAGSFALDTIQTPSGKVDSVLGGSINYFSIAASYYTSVDVLGVVGDDYPASHLEWLSTRNVNVSGIQHLKGKTFHWVGSYDEDLSEAKTLSTALNVFEDFDPFLNERQRNIPYLFLGNLDPILQLRVLQQVHSPLLVACDSMNFWITGKPDALKETLKNVDILSLNELEATLLSGEKNRLRAAESIRKMGPSVIIIKSGGRGALLFTDQGVFMVPAFPVENVVDPTGAGDSFAGAVMGYLVSASASREMAQSDPKKWDHLLRCSLISGCVMASFTIEDFSFKRLISLQKTELMQRQEQFLKMVTL